jgi:hypothetical protein
MEGYQMDWWEAVDEGVSGNKSSHRGRPYSWEVLLSSESLGAFHLFQFGQYREVNSAELKVSL